MYIRNIYYESNRSLADKATKEMHDYYDEKYLKCKERELLREYQENNRAIIEMI